MEFINSCFSLFNTCSQNLWQIEHLDLLSIFHYFGYKKRLPTLWAAHHMFSRNTNSDFHKFRLKKINKWISRIVYNSKIFMPIQNLFFMETFFCGEQLFKHVFFHILVCYCCNKAFYNSCLTDLHFESIHSIMQYE